MQNELNPRWLELLKKEPWLPSSRVFFDKEDCWVYGYDNSRGHHCPECVFMPLNTQEVKDMVTFCYQHSVPVTARGKGTGTTGGSIPLLGGVVISFEQMNKVIEYSPMDRTIEVEVGITNQAIQDICEKDGLFWAPDPTSAQMCTVGGNLALNAAGPKAVKYGTTRDNTLGLSAITGDGQLISTGVHTTKGVVGYDLTRLLIGSEGTLGIITTAILKLIPKPKEIRTLLCSFDSVRDAALCVSKVMGQPYIPCALEFIDGQAVKMIESVQNSKEANISNNTLQSNTPSAQTDTASLQTTPTPGAQLIIEIDGNLEDIDFGFNAIANIVKSITDDVQLASSEAQRQEIWKKRKSLSPALRTIAPKKINEDVVVPVSKLPEFITGVEALSKQYQITIINFGHAGNGNIHVNLLIDPDDKTQLDNAQYCLSDVFDLVIKLKGTLSGEHGVGLEKRAFIEREVSLSTLNIMNKIKSQFDPKSILNPGKIWKELGQL